MKKLLFSCFAILSINAAFSQKIAEDVFDEFKNVRKVKTESESLSKGRYFETMVLGYAVKDKAGLDTTYTLYFFFRASRVTSISEGSKIYFKLKDGTIETKHHEGDYKVATTGDFMGVYFGITPDFVESLKENPVVKIRVETTKEDVDVEVTDKHMNLISDMGLMVIAKLRSPYDKKTGGPKGFR